MEVTKKTDVGSLIAESIDNYYFDLGRFERTKLRAASRKAYFEWLRAEHLRVISEDAGDYEKHIANEKLAIDPRQLGKGDPSKGNGDAKDYRAGYKAGWVHAKRNPEAEAHPPEGKSTDYVEGYKAGHEKRKIGHQIVGHYNEGKNLHATARIQRAPELKRRAEEAFNKADELVAKHITGPSQALHYPGGGGKGGVPAQQGAGTEAGAEAGGEAGGEGKEVDPAAWMKAHGFEPDEDEGGYGGGGGGYNDDDEDEGGYDDDDDDEGDKGDKGDDAPNDKMLDFWWGGRSRPKSDGPEADTPHPGNAEKDPEAAAGEDEMAAWRRWVGAEPDEGRPKQFNHGAALYHAVKSINKIDDALERPDEHGIGTDSKGVREKIRALKKEKANAYRAKYTAVKAETPEQKAEEKPTPEEIQEILGGQHNVQHAPHPADLYQRMANQFDMTQKAKRRYGGILKGGQDVRGKVKGAQGLGVGVGGEAPEALARPEGDEEASQVTADEAAKAAEPYKEDLLRTALGDEAVDKHKAFRSGKAGGEEHPGITEFENAQHGGLDPSSHRKFTKHALDLWHKAIIDDARKAQAEGDTRLRKRTVPIMGNPTPKFEYQLPEDDPAIQKSISKLRDSQLAAFRKKHNRRPTKAGEAEALEPSQAQIDELRTFTGGGHLSPVIDPETGKEKTHTVDPVEILKNSLNDPYGFKATAESKVIDPRTGEVTEQNKGWWGRATAHIPGAHDTNKSVENPEYSGKPLNVSKQKSHDPRHAKWQRTRNPMLHWLQNSHHGNLEHEMWDYHYGHAPKGYYSSKRSSVKAKTKKGEEREASKTTWRPGEKWKKGQPTDLPKHKDSVFSPEALTRANELRDARTANANKYRGMAGEQAEELTYFMLGLLDEWLEGNTNATAARRQTVMEALYSRVEAAYGNLFEVAV